MARPNSRYFAPVIKKLVEAKRNEKIVIDPEFKVSLRSGLMSKIAGLDKGGRRGQFDRAKGDFGSSLEQFFRKWRYALALVPSALLLVLVAVQAMKLPVRIKTDTVVPVVVREEISVGQRPKIKTFAGSTVMPSKYRIKNEDAESSYKDFAEVSSLPAQRQDSKKETVAPKQPQPQVATEEQSAPVPQPQSPEFQAVPYPMIGGQFFYALPFQDVPIQDVPIETDQPSDFHQDQDVDDEVQFISPPPAQPLSGTSETPVSASGENQQQPQTVSSPTDSEPAKESVAPPVQMVPQLQSPAPQVNYSQPAQLLYDQPLYDAQIQNPANLNVGNLQTLSPIPAYAIYYNGHFSSDERTVFEVDVLASLVKGRELSYISVVERKDGVIAVEVHLKDGTNEFYYFEKNAVTHAWGKAGSGARFKLNYVRDGGFEPWPLQ